jgi:tRNA A-37 threonylcarbamoyl transferase component Bud32
VYIDGADGCAIQSASDFLKVGAGGGYLMTPVGSPVNIDVVEDRKTLFVMLYRLHQKGFAHGDPRWQNIIRFEGNLLWIDFDNFVLLSTPHNTEKDLLLLMASVYGDDLASHVCNVKRLADHVAAGYENIFYICEELAPNYH